jgi:alpha-galactosidase
MDKSAKPWEFWSFQGSSLEWGKDYIIPIGPAFHQENDMGVQPATKTGGGVPLIDLWSRSAGLSIAHLETKPQLVSFPVKADPIVGVTMSLGRTVNALLNPGEDYRTLKTEFTAHNLDYYEPLNTYSRLMADVGLKRSNISREAHEAIWCGWGYLTNFTLKDIYGTLPKLQELGIKWVVIDDRWWDRYGDWNPRKSTFPGGEKQVKEFVDSLHHLGFKIQVWWAPTPVQPAEGILNGISVDPGLASVAKEHPDWLIMDKEGNYPRDCRGMYQFCPTVPEVRQYVKQLTERFVGKWGFDGHKLDAYYVVPPCYNPAHHHQRPDESYEDLPLLLKTIQETSKSIKPWSVTEICNCGTNQDFFQSIYCDQPVNSDPTSIVQSRQRVKALKALWGPDAPVFTDHVEHIRPNGDMNDKSDTARVGDDFATSMGPGGVIGTKFTWPAGPENMQLKGEREEHWKKWFTLYNQKMLSQGNYLNVYDVVYDKPETHVIQKSDTLFYAFYADNWTGDIELRGLAKGKYKVWDYEHQRELGTVQGPLGTLNTAFKAHLLVECILQP